jgi:hypothetical protein
MYVCENGRKSCVQVCVRTEVTDTVKTKTIQKLCSDYSLFSYKIQLRHPIMDSGTVRCYYLAQNAYWEKYGHFE